MLYFIKLITYIGEYIDSNEYFVIIPGDNGDFSYMEFDML